MLGRLFADYASTYMTKGNYGNALSSVDSSLKYLEKDSKYFFYPNSIRANVFLATGNYEAALQEYLKILSWLNESSNNPLLFVAYNNIIFALNSAFRREEALKYCGRELALAEKLGNEKEIGYACINYFDTYDGMSQGEKAKPYILRLYKIAEKLNDSQLKASASEQMGTLKLREGEYGEAIKFYKEAVAANETQDKISLCNSLNSLGHAYQELKQPLEAEKYLLRALKLSQEINASQQLRDSYSLLTDNARLRGDYKKAYEYSIQFSLVSTSLLNEKSQQNIMELETRYQTEQKQKEIEIQSLKLKEQQAIISKSTVMRNLLIVISFMVLIVSALFVNRFKQKQLHKQLADRERISRDLHDEVGSSLGSIANFSEMARMKSEDFSGITQNELLEKIETTSRETIGSMSDIVWAINPRNDSMEQVISRMENFAADLLTPKNITYEFVTGKNMASIKPDMQKRKNIFLIFKEAIYNAIKYAECDKILIEIVQEKNRLNISVADNGKGFDINNYQSRNGNGIQNMKSRAMEVNGDLTIRSSGNGTFIQLEVPLA